MELTSTEECMLWRALLEQVKPANKSTNKVERQWIPQRSEIISRAKEHMLQNPMWNNPVTSIVAQILYRLKEWEFCAEKDTRSLPLLAAFLNSADVNWDSFVQFFSVDLFALEQLDPLKVQEIVSSLKTNWPRLEQSLKPADMRRIVDRVIQLWHLGMHLDMSHSRRITRAIANGMVELYRRFGRSTFGQLLRMYVVEMPHLLKFKYFFLSHLLDNVDKCELSVPLMVNVYKQLEECLKCQHLASITPNSMISLGLRFIESGALDQFIGLLKETLTHSVKVVRINCCRHWLPKVSTNHKVAAEVLGQLNTLLLVHLQHFNTPSSCHDANEEVWATTSEEVWWLPETYLWAWLNTFKYLIRHKKVLGSEQEMDYLRIALRSRQNHIKLVGVEVLQHMLLKLNLDQAKLEHLKIQQEAYQFVLANFGTDDVAVRKCVLDLFATLPPTSKRLLMNEFPDWLQPREGCSRNVERVLTLLKVLLLDIQFMVTSDVVLPSLLLSWLTDEEEQSVRTTCLQVLDKLIDLRYDKSQKEDLVMQIKHLIWLQTSGDFKLVSLNLFELLLKLGKDVEETFSVNCDEAIQIEMASLRVKYGFQQKYSLIASCLAVNQELLQLGGSSAIGICQPAYQLNHFINNNTSSSKDLATTRRSNNDEEAVLEWSEKERNVLSKYGDGLIHSCGALLTHSSHLDLCELTKCVDSVWQVMLRSHHRGVLEHCSDVFEGFVKVLAQDNRQLPLQILADTMELVGQVECESRDIAFSKMLVAICTYYPVAAQCDRVVLQLIDIYSKADQGRSVQRRVLHIIQKFLLSSALDLSAIHAPICDFLLRNSCTSDWKLFSLICSAFAAFIECLFSGMPAKVPLACFFTTNSAVLHLIYEKLVQLSVQSAAKRCSQKFLPLLIAGLERLVVVHFPFSSQQSHKYVKRLFLPLKALLLAEPALVVRRQILEVMLNMVPLQNFEKVKQLAQQLSGGTIDALTTDVLNTVHSYMLSHSTDISSATPKESPKLLTSPTSQLACCLEGIKINMNSKNVMKRIGAARRLLRAAQCLTSQSNTQLLLQFHSYFCLLITDEVEDIRLITAHCISALPEGRPFPMDPYHSIMWITNYLVSQTSLTATILAANWKPTERRFSKYLDDHLIAELLLDVVEHKSL